MLELPLLGVKPPLQTLRVERQKVLTLFEKRVQVRRAASSKVSLEPTLAAPLLVVQAEQGAGVFHNGFPRVERENPAESTPVTK